jgi:hypothetical protein
LVIANSAVIERRFRAENEYCSLNQSVVTCTSLLYTGVQRGMRSPAGPQLPHRPLQQKRDPAQPPPHGRTGQTPMAEPSPPAAGCRFVFHLIKLASIHTSRLSVGVVVPPGSSLQGIQHPGERTEIQAEVGIGVGHQEKDGEAASKQGGWPSPRHQEG